MEKYEKYGVLVTISSLLLVVVYSTGPYDSWDLMVTLITGYFGISFLSNKMSFDWFSSFNASFISVVSVTTGIIAANNLWKISELLDELVTGKNFGLSNHFIAVLALSIILSLLFKPKNA